MRLNLPIVNFSRRSYESKLKIRDIFAQNDFFKSMLIPGNTEYVREHLTQARQTSLQY